MKSNSKVGIFLLILLGAVGLGLIATKANAGSQTWLVIFSGLASAFLLFLLYRGIKANPEWLSLKSLNQSLRTLGLLALFLIAFLGFIIFLLRR